MYVERTFVSLVMLKRKGSSCFGGDPGVNYYSIVVYQCAQDLVRDLYSVISACFSLFHQNTESLFQGSVVLKKGQRCFAHESVDLCITRTFPPASQSPNSIDELLSECTMQLGSQRWSTESDYFRTLSGPSSGPQKHCAS